MKIPTLKLTPTQQHAVAVIIAMDKDLPADADPFDAVKNDPCPLCGHVFEADDARHLDAYLLLLSKEMDEAIPERMRPVSRATLGHFYVCPAKARPGVPN